MFSKVFARLFVVVLFVFAVWSVGAVDTLMVEGLNQPRGLAFDIEGNLYIADPGVGGDVTFGEETEFSQVRTAGATSQLLMIAPDGTQTVLLPHLASTGADGESGGLARVQITEDTIWLLFGEGAPFQPFTDTVIALDRETLRVKHFIDLMTYETLYNPDGTEEIYSNAHDMFVTESGLVYIIDTGANTLYTWTETDGLQVFQTWSDNPVPTSIHTAADGSLWVGFLGQHIAPGAGRVDHVATDGTVIESYTGLTAVTDVLVADDGDVYAVQMATIFGEQGPDFESGNVIRLEADNSTTPIMEGLHTPYALAQAPDGTMVVSTHSVFGAPASGAVMVVETE